MSLWWIVSNLYFYKLTTRYETDFSHIPRKKEISAYITITIQISLITNRDSLFTNALHVPPEIQKQTCQVRSAAHDRQKNVTTTSYHLQQFTHIQLCAGTTWWGKRKSRVLHRDATGISQKARASRVAVCCVRYYEVVVLYFAHILNVKKSLSWRGRAGVQACVFANLQNESQASCLCS